MENTLPPLERGGVEMIRVGRADGLRESGVWTEPIRWLRPEVIKSIRKLKSLGGE